MPSLPPLLALLQPAAPVGEAGGALWGDGLGAASPFGWAPVILLGGPVLVAVVLLWLYARTARQHRRALMAPPVWLLPYLERPAEAEGVWRPLAPDGDHAELEELRLESTARLARRKRVLLVGLGLNFVAAWAAAAAYLYSGNRSVEFQELPPSVPLESSVDTSAFQGVEGPGRPAIETDSPSPAPAAAPPDSMAERIRREQQARFVRRRDSLAEVRRQDSIAVVAAVALRIRDSVAQALRDSIARAQVAVPAPAPPPPAPPPAPAPDPAVELARAAAAIRARAEALAAAINGRAGLQGILTAGTERDRFLRFVEQQAPTVALQRVPDPAMSPDRAEAEIAFEFRWRGQFGVSRREVGRFQVEARRVNGAWQVARLVPLSTPH